MPTKSKKRDKKNHKPKCVFTRQFYGTDWTRRKCWKKSSVEEDFIQKLLWVTASVRDNNINVFSHHVSGSISQNHPLPLKHPNTSPLTILLLYYFSLCCYPLKSSWSWCAGELVCEHNRTKHVCISRGFLICFWLFTAFVKIQIKFK